MVYQITIKPSAVKTLAKINNPYYTNIKAAINGLSTNPRPMGYIQLKGRDAYRIRVGNYRIIYQIFDSELLIDVIDLGHRKDIYD